VMSRTLAGTLVSLAILLARLSAFATPQTLLDSLTLAWDPSGDPSVVGYRLYQGTASQAYTSVTDSGNQTSVAIGRLVPGVTYYFAVTAYDNSGLESTFSGEISYTVPTSAPLPPIVLQAQTTFLPGAGKTILLSITGPANSVMRILATQDFASWSTIATITLDSNGTSQVTDPASPFLPQRFYRIVQPQPQPASASPTTDPVRSQ
jgi:hypothetical protein